MNHFDEADAELRQKLKHEWLNVSLGEIAVEARRLYEAAHKRQLAEAREALDQIVVSEGEDAGVILLSSNSPGDYDPERKVYVYRHEFFSPLGDALVKLARSLK